MQDSVNAAAEGAESWSVIRIRISKGIWPKMEDSRAMDGPLLLPRWLLLGLPSLGSSLPVADPQLSDTVHCNS
jgi:hypothetical protein